MKTTSKYVYIFLIVLFCATSLQASLPKMTWRAGHVIFWNETILEGELAYNWSTEMIMFRQRDGRVHTYSPNQISRFDWFDPSQYKQQQFRSILHSVDKDRTTQTFFEVCMDGPLAVVRRLKRPRGLFRHVFSHPSHFTDQPAMSQQSEQFDYFVYDTDRLLTFERFYLDIIYKPLMAAHYKELKRSTTQHNINDRTTLGHLVLIDQCNSLVQQDAKTASARELVDVAVQTR